MNTEHTNQSTAPEPFGYFKTEPFGWTDCEKGDEGAVPLYEHATVQGLQSQLEAERGSLFAESQRKQQLQGQVDALMEAMAKISGMTMSMYTSAGEAVRDAKRIAHEAISAAEQAQQAEPRCACGDSFTSDAVCANCLATQQQAEPVAWQYRAKLANANIYGDWHGCSKQVHDRYKTGEFNGDLIFETRELFAQPPAVAVPDAAVGKLRILLAACNRIEAGAEEFESQDGVEMAIAIDYWLEFIDALEAARATLAAAPQGVNPSVPVADEKECLHHFVMLRNECVKCGQPYDAAQKGGE